MRKGFLFLTLILACIFFYGQDVEAAGTSTNYYFDYNTLNYIGTSPSSYPVYYLRLTDDDGDGLYERCLNFYCKSSSSASGVKVCPNSNITFCSDGTVKINTTNPMVLKNFPDYPKIDLGQFDTPTAVITSEATTEITTEATTEVTTEVTTEATTEATTENPITDPDVVDPTDPIEDSSCNCAHCLSMKNQLDNIYTLLDERLESTPTDLDSSDIDKMDMLIAGVWAVFGSICSLILSLFIKGALK